MCGRFYTLVAYAYWNFHHFQVLSSSFQQDLCADAHAVFLQFQRLNGLLVVGSEAALSVRNLRIQTAIAQLGDQFDTCTSIPRDLTGRPP